MRICQKHEVKQAKDGTGSREQEYDERMNEDERVRRIRAAAETWSVTVIMRYD